MVLWTQTISVINRKVPLPKFTLKHTEKNRETWYCKSGVYLEGWGPGVGPMICVVDIHR